MDEIIVLQTDQQTNGCAYSIMDRPRNRWMSLQHYRQTKEEEDEEEGEEEGGENV